MNDTSSDHPSEVEPDDDDDAIVLKIPAVTAPTFPVEHALNNSVTFFQRTIDGGMDVKFVALVTLPDGRNLPSPEATVIRFNPQAWERHKREVAADGEKSKIETVRHFPGGLLNGDVS